MFPFAPTGLGNKFISSDVANSVNLVFGATLFFVLLESFGNSLTVKSNLTSLSGLIAVLYASVAYPENAVPYLKESINSIFFNRNLKPEPYQVQT